MRSPSNYQELFPFVGVVFFIIKVWPNNSGKSSKNKRVTLSPIFTTLRSTSLEYHNHPKSFKMAGCKFNLQPNNEEWKWNWLFIAKAAPKVPCPDCPRLFRDANAQRNHESTSHHSCHVPNCPAPGSFKSNKQYSQHRLQYHNGSITATLPIPIPATTTNPSNNQGAAIEPYISQIFGKVDLPLKHRPKRHEPNFRIEYDRIYYRTQRDGGAILAAIEEGMPLPDHLMIRNGVVFNRGDNKKEHDHLYETPENETVEQRAHRHAQLDELADETNRK